MGQIAYLNTELTREYINADVRAGMIQGTFGQYIGDGFTLYFEEEF